MGRTELAALLALCAGTFNRRDWYQLDPDGLAKRCQQLDRFGVLSITALASIFDVSEARISRMVRHARGVRGSLNPRHLGVLAYALSNHDIRPETLQMLVDQGTSINMISKLTLISRATLHRRLKERE